MAGAPDSGRTPAAGNFDDGPLCLALQWSSSQTLLPKLLAARFRRASAILRPRHLRARSGGELETMPNELSSETEKTAGEESGSGEGGAESARDELGALAGLKPGGLTSAQEVQTTLLGGANCEP
jgi:hypothetical protein